MQLSGVATCRCVTPPSRTVTIKVNAAARGSVRKARGGGCARRFRGFERLGEKDIEWAPHQLPSRPILTSAMRM